VKPIKVGGEDFIGEAKKEKGAGKLKYKLWLNEDYELHVQLEDNEKAGSFTGRVFPVSKYLNTFQEPGSLDTEIGFDRHTEAPIHGTGSNDAGFLKAVLKCLLRCKEQ
jgi:hypothetical protein